MAQVREEKVSGVGGPRSVSRNSRTTAADNFEHQRFTLGQNSSENIQNSQKSQNSQNIIIVGILRIARIVVT